MAGRLSVALDMAGLGSARPPRARDRQGSALLRRKPRRVPRPALHRALRRGRPRHRDDREAGGVTIDRVIPARRARLCRSMPAGQTRNGADNRSATKPGNFGLLSAVGRAPARFHRPATPARERSRMASTSGIIRSIRSTRTGTAYQADVAQRMTIGSVQALPRRATIDPHVRVDRGFSRFGLDRPDEVELFLSAQAAALTSIETALESEPPGLTTVLPDCFRRSRSRGLKPLRLASQVAQSGRMARAVDGPSGSDKRT